MGGESPKLAWSGHEFNRRQSRACEPITTPIIYATVSFPNETRAAAHPRGRSRRRQARGASRSRTRAGTSSSDVSATQVASRPVGPFGSVTGRGRCPDFLVVLSVAVAAMAFLAFSSMDELVDLILGRAISLGPLREWFPASARRP